MPTSPDAIKRFLEYVPPPPPLAFRGDPPEVLLDMIERIIGEYYEKTKSRKHQLEGLAFAIWAERALLLFAMRTGKTKIALDWLSALILGEQLKKKALIIAHSPIGVDVWTGQIAQHSYLNVVPIISGGYTAERFMYAVQHEQCDAVLTSWSVLQTVFSAPGTITRGAKKGRTKLYADRELLREAAQHFSAVVVDEIHMLGLPDPPTLRFIIASELVTECRWRLGLTGTPFGRDANLLWSQAFILDSGRSLSAKYHFFREAFCNTVPNQYKRFNPKDYIFDSRKLPILRNKLSSLALHCALEDVQDVNVLRGVVDLKMSPEQGHEYDALIEGLWRMKTGNAAEVDNIFVRLRQVSSGFLPFSDQAGETRIVRWPDHAKGNWLRDFLENIPEGLSIVIFCEFTASGEYICELLREYRVSHGWLYGATKNRTELQEQFRTHKIDVMVANTATGGLSIDFAACDYLLFYESSASVIIRQQAEARPMARGSRPLVLDDLVCSPVEKKILSYMAENTTLRDAILRDPQRMARELRR